ncbi:1-pyrroline-5-carboxylate dehydrogenase, partial [Yinghuangia sp. KLBMP8922]|nr:1-pyrroline-5-carboxylate dehydrogenase [Yinghuangia soli]
MDAVTQVPAPVNEPIHSYAPGSPERARLEAELKRQAADHLDLTQTIGGVQSAGGGARVDVVQPHRHGAVLGSFAGATQADARAAV